jgi:hypothetical protein
VFTAMPRHFASADRKSACIALALVGLTACAEETFTVRYAPGFSSASKHVSVFGIKRNGLMSRDGWGALGPNVPAPFSAQPCDVAYGESIFTTAPALASAVEDYVRANGVTDELLDQLAPNAQGDTIMLLTIAGHARVASEPAGGSPTSRASAPGSMGRGGRGGRGGGGRGSRGGSAATDTQANATADDPFAISASFFSVHEHRSVALVQMSYSGTRIDQALGHFKERLEAEFPRATCSGWNWSVQPDEGRIRALGEP